MPGPFGDVLPFSLRACVLYPAGHSPAPQGMVAEDRHTGPHLVDIQEQEPRDGPDLGLELDAGCLLVSAARACRCSPEFKPNQTKPNLCHKETQSMLLPILKPALLPLCSSHLSSALLLSPIPHPHPQNSCFLTLGLGTIPKSLILHPFLWPLLPI